MHCRRFTLLLLAFAVLVALAACDSGGATDGGSSSSGSADSTSAEVFTPDLDWLEGEWVVETTLTYIDNSMMTPAADQPMAEWVCEIDGSTMYLVTDIHTYEGTITSEDGIDWRYVASSTYTDEGGVVWTSDIDVTATKTGEDAFVGEMLGEISSDTDGHLYSAQWHLNGSASAGD